MPPFIYPIASSSKGNCVYIGNGEDSGILVDIGVGPRVLINSLNAAGINPQSIKALFITHEHSDHISGIELFLKHFDIPVYGSYGTLNAVLSNRRLPPTAALKEINHSSVSIETFSVSSFKTSHDAADSRGYIIEQKGNGVASERTAVCTDLGLVTHAVQSALEGCKTVYLESNYCPEMLAANREYSPWLKNRIRSETGHLSNEECRDLAHFLVPRGTKNIILAHLSENNNTPEIALNETLGSFVNNGAEIGNDINISVARVRATAPTVRGTGILTHTTSGKNF
jgi:Metal-dependent hydrolases of the beta-lactamase superfamily I